MATPALLCCCAAVLLLCALQSVCCCHGHRRKRRKPYTVSFPENLGYKFSENLCCPSATCYDSHLAGLRYLYLSQRSGSLLLPAPHDSWHEHHHHSSSGKRPCRGSASCHSVLFRLGIGERDNQESRFQELRGQKVPREDIRRGGCEALQRGGCLDNRRRKGLRRHRLCVLTPRRRRHSQERGKRLLLRLSR